MPPVGFEPTIPADERPQTYAFDRTATGIGTSVCYWVLYSARYSQSITATISLRYTILPSTPRSTKWSVFYVIYPPKP